MYKFLAVRKMKIKCTLPLTDYHREYTKGSIMIIAVLSVVTIKYVASENTYQINTDQTHNLC